MLPFATAAMRKSTVVLSDFIIKDGGNAVIKGGQFYSLQVSGEGRNVGQLLADGYAIGVLSIPASGLLLQSVKSRI